MRQTDNFKLNLPELSDKLSPTPFNENTAKIDAMLAGGVRMACGTYTGNGAAACSISTPGFTPMAVLMTCAYGFSGGWHLWVGENLPAKYTGEEVMPDGSLGTATYDTTLQFTPVAGGLSWKLETAGDSPAGAVNNNSGTVYQWIAFGLPDGS